MKLLDLVIIAWAAGAAQAVAGEALTVSYSHTVKPEAALVEFAGRLHALGSAKGKPDLKAIEAMFSPRVKAFTRGLDPFSPWNQMKDLTGNYLSGVADAMVEQGELAAGMPVPDYRVEAARQLADLVSKDVVFGTVKEVPGAVCAPAVYKVARRAALAFARKYELDAYSLRFYARPVSLYAKYNAKSELVATVPAYTLMMFDYDPKAPEGWGKYEASNGIVGGMKDDDVEALGLSQHHVCFGKVKGQYRITAVFGYGL